MKKLNENIAYAKSILNKLGILNDSELYNDYLKIREICGVNTGYVGILTKIRFIDNIEDMEEIKSIFDILKNSKIDINKLNKLNYNDILNIFYNEFNNKDYELYYQDDEYIYYLVHTYEGILQIGSPAWCLKTKKNWDNYKKKYTHQWVVINKKYKNILINPNNNYLDKYYSKEPWIRFGISISLENNTFSFAGYNDNNYNIKLNHNNHTFFGVITTIFNLMDGIKKSYYDFFSGCEKVDFGNIPYLKINNYKYIIQRLGIDKTYFNKDDEMYIIFSKSYSYYPAIFILNENYFKILIITNKKIEEPVKINHNSSIFENILIDYAKRTNSDFYSGIKLMNNLTTLDEIKKSNNFITKIDNWLIFDSKSHYLIVNTFENTITIHFDNSTLNGLVDNNNPQMCWFLRKDAKYHKNKIKEYQPVIDFLIKSEDKPEDKPEDKTKKKSFIKKFLNF